MSARRFREWNLECKVYIGNLSESACKQDVESVLSKYGPLKNIWVARNPPGFAFVEYEDPRDADDAVRALDGTRICGSRVRVEKSHGRSKRNPPSRRYGGLDRENGRYYPKSRRYSPVRRRSRSRTGTPPKRGRYSRSRSHSRSRSRNRSVTPRSLLRSPRSPISPRSPLSPRSPRSPPPRSPMSPGSQILIKSPKNGHRDDDSRSRSRSRSITPDD